MKINEQKKFFGKEAGEDWALFIYNRKSPFPVIIENIGVTYPNPKYRVSRTNNDMFIFEYILSGSGYIETNGETFKVSANDVYIIEPGQDHTYYSDPSKTGGVNLTMTIKGLSKLDTSTKLTLTPYVRTNLGAKVVSDSFEYVIQ